MRRILVINPNSSQSMTAAMDSELDLIRDVVKFEIVSMTMTEGPAAIESRADVESVVKPVAELVRQETADAFILACFSDPGLALAREATSKPVFGIAESAFLAALGLGFRFGIIAILEQSIPHHVCAINSLGLRNRLAGDLAINSGVSGLDNETASLPYMISAATRLRDQCGADTVILGCAGMGRYRSKIERAVGLPVIDPVQAAVVRAVNYLSLGYRPA